MTVSGMLRSLGRLPEITRAGQEPQSLEGGEQCTLLEGARNHRALCMAGFPVGFDRCAGRITAAPSRGLTWAVPCHPLMGLTRAAWVRMIRSHFAGSAGRKIFKMGAGAR